LAVRTHSNSAGPTRGDWPRPASLCLYAGVKPMRRVAKADSVGWNARRYTRTVLAAFRSDLPPGRPDGD
jgi:hypothetical protein